MSEVKSSFTRKETEDGGKNPKYVDLLEEDKPVAGQKFVCVSFVSPENVLKKKELFFFEEFLKHWDFSKAVGRFTQFLHFLAYKHDIEFDKLVADLQDFTKSEGDKLAQTTIAEDYKNFLDAKEGDLQESFSSMHSFTTNTRGLKVRGCYPTQAEAELRCRMLREVDPNHDVYVGPVGMWMPWDPEAYKTGRVEYLEEELNELMHEKHKNEQKAKAEFDKRLAESRRTAIEENKKLAKASGNKLTQTLDGQGNLVGVANMSSIETNLGDGGPVTTADIRKELFEGENIRTRAKDKEMEAAKVALKVTEKVEEEEEVGAEAPASESQEVVQDNSPAAEG